MRNSSMIIKTENPTERYLPRRPKPPKKACPGSRKTVKYDEVQGTDGKLSTKCPACEEEVGVYYDRSADEYRIDRHAKQKPKKTLRGRGKAIYLVLGDSILVSRFVVAAFSEKKRAEAIAARLPNEMLRICRHELDSLATLADPDVVPWLVVLNTKAKETTATQKAITQTELSHSSEKMVVEGMSGGGVFHTTCWAKTEAEAKRLATLRVNAELGRRDRKAKVVGQEKEAKKSKSKARRKSP